MEFCQCVIFSNDLCKLRWKFTIILYCCIIFEYNINIVLLKGSTVGQLTLLAFLDAQMCSVH